MLDQTLLMQTLKDIADTGERLSNQSEENAFVVIAEAFKNVGAAVEIERVPLFVSTVDSVCLKADGQRIDALGNAMTLRRNRSSHGVGKFKRFEKSASVGLKRRSF